MSIHIPFLSSGLARLFSMNHKKNADNIHRRLYINQIIENVVDDIDPRLRGLMGYKKALYPCVDRVLTYAEKICSRLPGPLECSRETHRTNATIRSIFADYKTMRNVFSRNKQVQEFFDKNPAAVCAYLVLGMKMSSKQTLGMQQQGDIIIKDVLQTTVNFDDYRISHPSTDEETLRFNLRERAVHECVAQTLKKLIDTQSYNHELEEQEVKLKMQLSLIKNQHKGLSSLVADDPHKLQRMHEIETEIARIEHQHIEISKDVGTLNGVLKKAGNLLKNPAELIEVSTLSFCLDRFNRMMSDNEKLDNNRVNLAEITFSKTEKRVGVLVSVPRKEITAKPGFQHLI